MRIVVILALCIWSCQAVRDGPVAVEQSGLGRNCSCPKLPDGFVVPDQDSYEDDSTAHYGCKKGKKPALTTWWGEIKCADGKWSHLPQCIDDSSCITPHVPNAEPQELDKHYATGEEVSFICKKAYRPKNNKNSALCENGQWDLPVCERQPNACDPPTRVDNAMIKQDFKELYANGETLEFVCKPGYELKGWKRRTCTQKSWGRLPECVVKKEEPKPPAQPESGNRQPSGGSAPSGGAGHGSAPGGSGSAGGSSYGPTTEGSGSTGASPCGESPHIPHGTISAQAEGMVLVVQCPLFYKLVGSNRVYCEKGKWTELPVCKPPCVLDAQRFHFYYPNDKYLEEGIRKNYWCNTNSLWIAVSCVDGVLWTTCPYPQ